MPVVDRELAPRAKPILELENGARLTRAEFERRYEAMPWVKKAELIEGIVHMASPVGLDHGRGQGRLTWWLTTYSMSTPGTDCGANATVHLDNDNEPQPDVHMRVLPESGGQTHPSGKYIGGAPELVVEVAVSSSSADMHAKLNAYRRNGVREYIVWRVADEALDWFILRDGEFCPLAPDAAGALRSEVFPGLRLDAAALLKDDMKRVLAVLQEGLASEEHARFVSELAARPAAPA